ncbi:MAG: tetratricopeptide repeat protein [Spirochaetaceae bacterium]|jgi:tetratricopeptide (TPR) repeat protein|nr:tetratricopeptide repeat protein [Spirochaetaceae bacterium]
MFLTKKAVKFRLAIKICGCVLPLFFSCSGAAQVREMPLERPALETATPATPSRQPVQRENQGGIAARIRSLCNSGSLSSMREAVAIISENGIEQSEFGRVMNAVIAALLEKVYALPQSAVPEPPRNHPYSRILADAVRGIYREPPPESADYLEYVLPFLALLNDVSGSRLAAALPDLEKAESLDPSGALAPYFIGAALERTGRRDEASAMYDKALALSPDCYPAALGIARIMQDRGLNAEAAEFLAGMSGRYPDNVIIKRELARAYISERDWADAGQIIEQALKESPDDPALNLMRALVLFETGQLFQTQALLDRLAAASPQDRDYLFLRARLHNEGFKNRDNAVAILSPLYRLNPADLPVALYLTRLMLESNDEAEQAEGGRMLKELLKPPPNGGEAPLDVILLAFNDAVRRADWQDARQYQDRILSERRTPDTLFNAFLIERGSGNSRAALAIAQELIQNYPSYERGRIAYVEALIDSGRHGEAMRLIDERVPELGAGGDKSRYYYLRGILRGDLDSAVSDFRASLFENPRNLDALKALVELYRKRGDTRHAVYYLRQALAIAPRDPVLQQYQREYEGSL